MRLTMQIQTSIHKMHASSIVKPWIFSYTKHQGDFNALSQNRHVTILAIKESQFYALMGSLLYNIVFKVLVAIID